MSVVTDQGDPDRSPPATATAGVSDDHAGRIIGDYKARRWRHRLIVGGLVAVVMVLAITSLLVGASSFSLGDSWAALWRGLLSGDLASSPLVDQIVWQLRLPRVLIAISGGMALALAGMLMQTILRNPLASPYTLGIASAASFGAALAIMMRASVLSLGAQIPYNYVVVVNAFLFALLSTAAVYLLTRLQRVTPETIVLLGIAMMFMFSALTSLVQYLGDPDELATLTYWMFGSLNQTTWSMVWIVTAVCFGAAIVSYRWVWDLNALTADDESAASVGINVPRIRLKAMVIASLLTATVVAFVGPIGFIGLVSPHLARMLVGGDHRVLFPISLLVGAIVLLVADTVARTVVAPVVIPVGIITAFIGVPILILLMLRRRAEHW